MYIYTCIYIFICICMYLYMYMCIHLYMHIMHTYVYAYMHRYVYVYTYTDVYVYKFMHCVMISKLNLSAQLLLRSYIVHMLDEDRLSSFILLPFSPASSNFLYLSGELNSRPWSKLNVFFILSIAAKRIIRVCDKTCLGN